ncbi:MAG TPA: hypothetical protein VHP83_04055 [Aggregatilineaceae bacterium]|nr:hypothetical protein [Aggregatilineaceae bacterium]
MLEGLDQIDWKSRDAENVPDLIRGIVSKDKETRSRAHELFEHKVVLGGESFETTDLGYGIASIFRTDLLLVVLPFLIELLNEDQVPAKGEILYDVKWMSEFVRLKPAGEIYHERARQLRAAIWANSDTYIRLLHDQDADTRIEVVFLLIEFMGEQGQFIFFSILHQLEVETDLTVKREILWILHLGLTKHPEVRSTVLDPYVKFLRQVFAPDQEIALRRVAAVCLIEALKSDAPPEAREMLQDFMMQKPEFTLLPYYYLIDFWSAVSDILDSSV